MAPFIEIDRLCKSFDGGRRFAVHDVTLQVELGLFVALVGASGSGKTTTLKFINRLLEPDSGTVRIDGEPVGVADAATLRRHIGYVFQGIGLFPHMSVGENIAITPQLLGWPRARSPHASASFGPGRAAAELRVAIAGWAVRRRTAARRRRARHRGAAEIVLMDEPFGALDPITRDPCDQAYRALHGRLGLTTIMVTHDVQEAVLLADRIAVMNAGRILAYDTPRALLSIDGDRRSGRPDGHAETPSRAHPRPHRGRAAGGRAWMSGPPTPEPPARLSRPAHTPLSDRARARNPDRLARCGRRHTPSRPADRCACGGKSGADHSGPRPAGAVLPAAARPVALSQSQTAYTPLGFKWSARRPSPRAI